MKHKLFCRLSALALALVLALPAAATPARAAGADTPDTPATVNVTGISLNKTTLSLVNDPGHANYTELLVCTQKPDGASAAIKWSSSDDKVAFVSDAGLVTAAGKGTATVTAKAVDGEGNPIKVGNREITATCKVSVREPIPVTSVTLDHTSLRLNPGDTVQLTATVLPANADNKTVTWKSDNESVATVDENGLVTAVAGDGAATTIRAMEAKGYVEHEVLGPAHRFKAIVDKDYFRESSLSQVVRNYFGNSYKNAVSAFAQEEKISVEDLREIIRMMEANKGKS